MLAIETEGLTKRFGSRLAVDAVALQVPVRGVYGFLGPNGAGKTTVMRLLLGLLRPDSGRVRLLGHDVARHRRLALACVGSFVESASLYDHLSGRANLELTRTLLGLPKHEVDRVLELVDLTAAAGARAGSYSLGMKQRLALARALMGSPRLLLLDEPTNGLDPDGIIAMRELIRELPDRIGGTVFVSSHLLSEIEQVAGEVGVMRSGRLVRQGSVATLLGTGRRIRYIVDDPARGAAVLRATGFSIESGESGSIRLCCPDDAAASGMAAAATRRLVEAGLAVSAVVPEARSLEDVYRETEHDRGERRAA